MQHVRDWKGATALSGRFTGNDRREIYDISELRKAMEKCGERLYRNYLRDGMATYDQATIELCRCVFDRRVGALGPDDL